MRTFLLTALALTLAACVQDPRQALEGDLSTIQKRLDNLQIRMESMERSSAKSTQTLEESDKAWRQARADQGVVLEDLRVEINSLKGNLDVLQHDLKTGADTQEKVRQDFDARLSELENKRATSPAPKSGRETPKSTDVGRYGEIYKTMQETKDYDQSIEQFEEFLRDYPDSTLKDDAQYWIGYGFFVKQNYARSIEEMQRLVDDFPKSEKICEGILTQGMAFRQMKELTKAKLFLTEVTKKCPKSSAATRAKAQMTAMAKPAKR